MKIQKLKANKNFTVKDQLLKYQEDEKVEEKLEREKDIEVSQFDEVKNSKLIAYNENITVLDSMYSELKPIRKVICRAFVQVAKEDENGVLKSPSIFVKKITDAGYGYAGVIENPFPYSRKVIVVAVPEHLKASLSPGDIVLLEDEQVQSYVSGRGDNAEIVVKNAFIRSDIFEENSIPQDPENRHFGYLKIDYSNIEIKL